METPDAPTPSATDAKIARLRQSKHVLKLEKAVLEMTLERARVMSLVTADPAAVTDFAKEMERIRELTSSISDLTRCASRAREELSYMKLEKTKRICVPLSPREDVGDVQRTQHTEVLELSLRAAEVERTLSSWLRSVPELDAKGVGDAFSACILALDMDNIWGEMGRTLSCDRRRCAEFVATDDTFAAVSLTLLISRCISLSLSEHSVRSGSLGLTQLMPHTSKYHAVLGAIKELALEAARCQHVTLFVGKPGDAYDVERHTGVGMCLSGTPITHAIGLGIAGTADGAVYRQAAVGCSP
jgi:hypothetical protein